MTNYVGLDVSQKTTTLCIVDGEGHRQWRGECVTSPEHIAQAVLQHAGAKASIGIETGPMTPWLVPLWTLESLRLGPDDAAANADRGENHDPRGERSG